jgi:hypothetical protein
LEYGLLENYLAILAKEAIAISKPTGLLANDIKRKIKPSVAICHLLLLKALEITYPRLKSLLISSIF